MLNYKQWLILIIFSLICFKLSAQLTPYQSFYQYNWQIVNPAAIDKSFIYDENRAFIATASYRKQWVGIANSPETAFISIEHKPSSKNRFNSGIKYGFHAYRDKADALSNNGFYGNFSYYFPIARSGKFIHIGTTVGLIWQQLDLNQGDFKVPESRGIDLPSRNFFDVNIGIFYRDKRKFYAGVSVPQLLSLDFNDGFSPSGDRQIQKFYNLILGGFLDSDSYSRFGGSSTWVLEPSVWVRYTPEFSFQSLIANRPFSADANLKFHYNQTIWFGSGYSTNQFVNFEFGIGKELDGGVYGHNSDKITIGASWQLPVGNRMVRLGNSFEIKLAYAWN